MSFAGLTRESKRKKAYSNYYKENEDSLTRSPFRLSEG